VQNLLSQVIIDEAFEHLIENPDLLWFVPRAPNKHSVFHKLYKTYLHRIVTKAPKHMVVDHINGNPLDNRLVNLRIATAQENAFNRTAKTGRKYSKFKNVFYDPNRSGNKKWKAIVDFADKRKQSWHETELDAAFHANAYMKEMHGSFAKLNLLPSATTDFKADLAFAQTHEDYLASCYPQLFKRADGRKWDLETLSGAGVEVKFDRYNGDLTANIFLESIRNDNSGQPGGPYQALQHGSKYFLYVFSGNYELLLFQTESLCNMLDKYVAETGIKPLSIANKGYNTLGYLVPKHVAITWTIPLPTLA
jgi:hypothetical protein